MEIATNAVLLAVLVQVSDLVEKLELPLQSPLQASNVTEFRIVTNAGPEDASHLSVYLKYEGGYEFWHQHGRIGSFCTPNSLVGHPERFGRLTGEIRASEAACLAKAKWALRQLGYTNISLLDTAPKVRPPFPVREKMIPHYIFEWMAGGEEPGERSWPSAEIEINANRLTIEKLDLVDAAFWGRAWPVTFGQTNVSDPEPPPQPIESALRQTRISDELAKAHILAILPEVNLFCSKLEMALPNPIREADILMGESFVAMVRARPLASIKLTTGHKVSFQNGHVTRIQRKESYFNSPWRDESFRKSTEYLPKP